jgi:protein-disulfide isomerase
VEFADFQCPYCKRAESSLHAVLKQYPRDVRIVFRNLPLTQIHPQAESAAEAAVCADRQGKFWEMHDAMYADQSALSIEALKDTAKQLGLNLGQFSACLSGGTPAAALDADAKAAEELGLSGTPYFFINGRPVDGNVPLEKFQSIIAEELHAGASDRG